MKHIPTSGYIWENTTKVKKRWDWCKLAHTHYTSKSLWLVWKKKICDEKQLQLLYIATSIELLLNYRINMFNASLTWPHILVSISWHLGITQLLHLILRDISCIDKQIITDWYCIQNPVAFVSNLKCVFIWYFTLIEPFLVFSVIATHTQWQLFLFIILKVRNILIFLFSYVKLID